MLPYENVSVYDFQTIPEIYDFNNYRDATHYSQHTNAWMVKAMKDDKFLLTKENYNQRCEDLREIVKSYDYPKAYKELDVIHYKKR